MKTAVYAEDTIPNNIHMMWFVNDEAHYQPPPFCRPFSFINYLAIRAAKEVHNPDNLFMYYNVDLPDNPHWQAAKQYATFVQVEAPTELEGITLRFPQYQSDVFRLQKLYAEGGIYLDTDAITTKPFSDLLHNRCVLSVDHEDKSIPNHVILARPGHPFLKRWLDKLASELNNPVWATHSVVLPYRLYEENPAQVDEYHVDLFHPFGWQDRGILGTDLSYADRLNSAYCVHMWETIWTEVANIDNNYLRGDTVFAHMFGKYAARLKIAVYAISKNEEAFVERFCNSAADADLITIADTGSTDATVELAQKHGAIVNNICITPWRFDDARNAALALLPRDIDVCVSLDLDEELQPGWREEIERVWSADTTRMRYGFDWGAGIVFQYEKIHARHGYRWTHPCHEYPIPYGIEEKYADTDRLLVIHKPDPTKSRGQYLPLLEMSIKEDPHDPRNAFYYARELSFHGLWQQSIDECNRYLALPGATWANERCYAYRVMARCYNELGDWENAIKSARLGVAEAPYTREPWCEIAKLSYQRQNWAECYGASMSALAITNREFVYTVDPEVWGSMPYDYAAISAWNLGMKEEAEKQVLKALEFEPDNERLKSNLAWFKKSL